MTELFFSCRLLSDIILNSKLATEGNMSTLDYIPGSNFLGIAASKLYTSNSEENYRIFHSDEVSFGDAITAVENAYSYVMPLSFYAEKSQSANPDGSYPTYLQHSMNKNNLKQVRQGYFNAKGILKKQVAKTFSLKSAQDAATRKAKDSQMFGIESLEEGQTFIFSVRFQNEEFVDLVTNALLGNQRVGKSRSAEFGQVQIKPITSPNLTGLVENKEDVIVFAQSNLCILDNHGNPSFQPSPEDLGVIGGAIDWSKSQIRTYSYSPWNGKRSSTSTQRDCIAMGSVIYIKGGKSTGNLQVGAYNSEGLGRILHNPNFLLEHGVQGNSDFLKIPPQNAGSNAKSNNNNTPLSTFLSKKKVQLEKDLELSKSVSNAVRSSNFKQKIPPSQWGSIRSLATNEPDGEKLYEKLFKENSTDRQQDGYLVKGVAAKRYWDKNRSRETLKSILTGNNNGGTKEVILSSQFVAKYAAEMAKKHKNSKNEK